MNAKVHFQRVIFVFIVLTGYMTMLQSQNSTDSDPYPAGMAPGKKVQGYVILSSGDTVDGMLRWTLKYLENQPVEVIFTANNGISKKMNANEIKGFGQYTGLLPEPEHYVSLPSMKKGVPVFINRLITGRITVYQDRSSFIITDSKRPDKIEGIPRIEGIHFGWVPGRGLYFGFSLAKEYQIVEYNTRFSSYFVTMDNSPMVKVTKDGYDSFFNTFFGNCPAIDDEVMKNPDLKTFQYFMIIAEVFNNLCK